MRWIFSTERRDRVFPAFVSPRDANNFVASLVVWEKEGSWADGEDVWMKFNVQHFFGGSVEDVLGQGTQWLDSHFGASFSCSEA